jgi:hypothetical protein
MSAILHTAQPLARNGRRLDLGGDPIRLLMITNEPRPGDEPGLREAYASMVAAGEIGSFRAVAPVPIAAEHGRSAALSELVEVARAEQPNVVLVLSPTRLEHDAVWVQQFLRSIRDPAVLYWEGDAWHRLAKPVNRSVRAWLAAADVVFTVARRPQDDLFRRLGARDVRFIPHTYCHVQFREGEEQDPRDEVGIVYDVVVIGSGLAHFGLVSRMPGARDRARLVRRLQRQKDLRVAVFGSGWRGRCAKGRLPYSEQVRAIRQALVSANWDYFPRYESYVSDRLATSLIAGRAHVTTGHRGLKWLPGGEAGLFLEPSVPAVIGRLRQLVGLPVEHQLELGARAHRWVKNRLSDRQAARYILGAVDGRMLEALPSEPWHRLVDEWPLHVLARKTADR